MKVNRHGKAKILTQEEIQLIFSSGLHNERDRTLFGVCLFTACRIREACTLLTRDIYTPSCLVRPKLILRKANTKGKLATRSIPVIEDLRQLLTSYRSLAGKVYLFPGRSDGHLAEDSAARILRTACQQVGITGVSTHSFRRTALTQMSNAGIPLRVIQEISGHRNLEQLQKYLEVSEEQVLGAASSLAMLSPVGQDVGKYDLAYNVSSKLPYLRIECTKSVMSASVCVQCEFKVGISAYNLRIKSSQIRTKFVQSHHTCVQSF